MEKNDALMLISTGLRTCSAALRNGPPPTCGLDFDYSAPLGSPANYEEKSSTMKNVGAPPVSSCQLPHVIRNSGVHTSATAAGLTAIRAPIPFSCMAPDHSTRDEITPHRSDRFPIPFNNPLFDQ